MKTTTFKIPEGRELRIAISGPSGCGNTTVSNLIAKILNLPCINYTFKNIAREMGIPFDEVLKRAQKDFSFDKMVDQKQIELASASSCVLGSRLAIWLLKSADLRVYLQASIDVRAKRIQNREGGDIEKIKADTNLRDLEDTRRYKELYGIDNTKYEKADLIIDTENLDPDKITEKILDELICRGLLV
ncbi:MULTISPECIES: (d)CMP kinase [unclassified Treponema]|uniref:(d)CMP kinase n=1 Tax=unclassified Treponema TaxID=2638727 RepID=UPI0020A5DF93|nr:MULTISPECIES: AAA family ATPase [unclassified Treponema]UTC65947.1 AAA family ATPase [Treponema sp. OMZ 789]UTC68675.1 AAA family ATPase [Treponema sp. OMZ 790]UTC71405.1 AAA family ATPase [Treponema sp. OMZ 791]